MAMYNPCPYCGANLDPGEVCDCLQSKLIVGNRTLSDNMQDKKRERAASCEHTPTTCHNYST